MTEHIGPWHEVPNPNGWVDPEAADLPIGDDEPAGVLGEVWPLTIDPTIPAEQAGIWLCSGTLPWTTPFKKQGVRLHDLIVRELTRRDIPVRPTTPLHQTSDRDIGIGVVHTYMAVIPCDGPVRARWPLALPVSTQLAAMVGPPPTHASGERPQPRDWDVLIHGLGHLHRLYNTNATFRRDLAPAFAFHLGEWEETLFQQFERVHGTT
ncbi:MAG TPA: hypothetical protein VG276_28260 [Actinomycetes bacterium]|jgi:hypothetical protein|nr:hypothetical protein [Actinomycetes bacterium]